MFWRNLKNWWGFNFDNFKILLDVLDGNVFIFDERLVFESVEKVNEYF